MVWLFKLSAAVHITQNIEEDIKQHVYNILAETIPEQEKITSCGKRQCPKLENFRQRHDSRLT